MMSYLILCCLMVCTFIRNAATANSYVVTMPNLITPGVSLGMHVHILNAPADVTINAHLINRAGTRFTSVIGKFSNGDSGYLELLIPELTRGDYQVQVIGSGGLSFNDKTDVRFRSNSAFALIQTDRVYYSPGETVKLRVMAMFPNLLPYDGGFDVFVYDSDNTALHQWRGVTGYLGVWEKEFPVREYMKKGKWEIRVNVQGEITKEEIIVREIIIPKFNVTIDSPMSFTAENKQLSVTINARYSFDKPVIGTAHIQVLVESSLKVHAFKVGNFTGTETYTFNNLPSEDVIIVAQVGVELAGTTVTSSKVVTFVTGPPNVEFVFEPGQETFSPGLQYTTFAKVPKSFTNDVKIVSTITKVQEKTCKYGNKPYKVVTKETKVFTGLSRTGQFLKFNAKMPINAFDIELKLQDNTGILLTKKLQSTLSPSKSYLQILPEKPELKVGEDLSFLIDSNVELKGQIVVQVVSRGSLVWSKAFPEFVRRVTIPTSSSFSPRASVLVYNVLPSGEIISDEFHIDVKGNPIESQLRMTCTNCQSSLTPGSQITLDFKTAPNSVVYLLGVDKTINFVQTGYDVSVSDVVQKIRSYSDEIQAGVSEPWFAKSKVGGMNVITDAKLNAFSLHERNRINGLSTICIKPRVRVVSRMNKFGIAAFDKPSFAKVDSIGDSSFLDVIPDEATLAALNFAKTREKFPKTWIWDSVNIGPNGEAQIKTGLPDTITKWRLTGFSSSYTDGFAIAEAPVEVKTFKDLFIEVTIPRFVVVGNHIIVRVTIFNYRRLPERIAVEVEKDDDPNFWETKIERVRSGQQKSVVFKLKFDKIIKTSIKVSAYVFRKNDHLDTVRKPIDVKAPGIRKEYNIPTLIGLSQSSRTQVKNVALTYESQTVAGSKSIYVTVTGNILTPSIDGLDKLIRMPTGCGEQNMLNFAPAVFIIKYLKSVNKLSVDLKLKTTEYMIAGKRKQLTYQRGDGSYSAWGSRDPTGSTWLTAFVVLTFHEAQEFIVIEPNILKKSVAFLLSKQNADGSFLEGGRVIHYVMQGGSRASAVTMTSYVLLALLENDNLPGYENKIREASNKARAFIEGKVQSVKNTEVYTLALTAYALKKAQSTQASAVYNRLSASAIKEGLSMHWKHGQTRGKRAANLEWMPPNPRARPIDIETTAYALLYNVLSNEFDASMSIVRWMTSQRNPNGGFSSTQDTVVSLRALTEFSSLLNKRKNAEAENIQVSLRYNGKTKDVYLSKQNKDLLQTVQIKGEPQNIQIQATGLGIVIVDVVVKYNVPAKTNKIFTIEGNATSDVFDPLFINTCVSRNNNEDNGMVVTEVSLPSGYTVDLNTISKVSGLQHTEKEIDKVVLYFEKQTVNITKASESLGRTHENGRNKSNFIVRFGVWMLNSGLALLVCDKYLTTSKSCFRMRADRIDRATQSQALPIVVYDYYEPENQGSGEYTSGLLKNSNICKICGTDCPECSLLAVG